MAELKHPIREADRYLLNARQIYLNPLIKQILLLTLFLLSVILPGFSQERKQWKHSYTHRHFGMREGLAQTQAFNSFQDSYGYLWFSTYNGGVSRFDGLHFDNFNYGDLKTPPGSRILYFNQYGSAVFIVTNRGIVFVSPDQTIENYPFSNVLLPTYIDVVYIGDYLYIFNCRASTQSNPDHYDGFTLIRFDLKNKTYKRIAENLPNLRATVSDGKIYAVKTGEIINFQLTLYGVVDEQVQVIKTIPVEKHYKAVEFAKTQQNEWFAKFEKGIEPDPLFDFCQFFFENDSIRWICRIPDSEAKDWRGGWRSIRRDDRHILVGKIGSSNTINMINTDDWSMTDIPLDMLQVNELLRDRDDNIWISTEEGVYQCTRFFFESYQLGLGRNDNIWGVIKDLQGNVWFSSFIYGFWRVDKQGYIYPAKISNSPTSKPVISGYMSNSRDSSGRIFQTYDNGIAISDIKNKDPNRLDITKTGVSLAVYHDQENGKTYFGGETSVHRTLNVLDANGELTVYPSGVRHILSIGRDGNRKLRISDFRTESRLDEENHILVTDTIKRPFTGIISMALDEKGIFWKGTASGLFAEDRQGNDRQISDKNIDFVVHYRNQYIIWGEKDKLLIMDLQAYHYDGTVRTRIFGYYDGYDLMENEQNGASIDPEGYVWIAGIDKAIRFHPEQIMKIPPLQPYTPTIGSIYKADKNSEWSLLQTVTPITVDNKDNFLRFDLLQASVSAPDQLVFRYRLAGYQEQWTTAKERSIVFQNLPFGRYQFEVQSSFDNGQRWSESLFSPSITILRPFWLTFTGLLLIFTAFTGIVLFVVYVTQKTSIRKEEEKRKIDHLRYRAVQAKFIPHFTGNVLNSINFLVNTNPQSAQLYISKFNEFSNQTLRDSGKLTRSLQEELDYTQLYLELEKLRFEEKLEYTIEASLEVSLQKEIPSMILQTFCENAIKHGLRLKPEGGKIEIKVYKAAGNDVLSVSDNGIGRAQARTLKTEGTKEGLKIVQQQLEIFNKNRKKAAHLNIVDLTDESGQPAGTRFELVIPA